MINIINYTGDDTNDTKTTYRVEAIHTSLDLERRLEALGLTDGSLITVINNEKKGAMTARFRGARFALGRQIAEQITVSEVNPHE